VRGLKEEKEMEIKIPMRPETTFKFDDEVAFIEIEQESISLGENVSVYLDGDHISILL